MDDRIAIGLKENKGRKSDITYLGAAKAIAFYNPQTSELNIVEISKECKDRLDIIFKDISAIYHPSSKICPYIKKRAELEGVALKTGKYQDIGDLIDNLAGLDDLE